MRHFFIVAFLSSLFSSCYFRACKTAYGEDDVHLPKGFHIEIFADQIPGARSMALGAKGTVFIGTRSDRVYAITPNADGTKAAHTQVIATNLNSPNGVAYLKGSLYVAEINHVIRYVDIEENLSTSQKPTVVSSSFPSDTHHGWKYIAFGPDGFLYIPVGAPCNICEKKDPYAALLRMKSDGSALTTFAHGIRNTVGFDWDPLTKNLWFTDNGRDFLGDNFPPDELNLAAKPGLHFGYPYCHGGDIADPDFKSRPCSEFEKPMQKLDSHVAALGMKFYRGTQFPSDYRNQIFIAEHGSWNRTSPIGYRVSLVKLDSKRRPISYEVFADGWLKGSKASARPVDILELKDGSILVSDDFGGKIFRIFYSGR
jgi:glucose/arabinose dehydrogenase